MGRDGEVGAAIGLDRHRAQHVPHGHHRIAGAGDPDARLVRRAAGRDGHGEHLHHAKLFDASPFRPGQQALVDVHHRDRRPGRRLARRRPADGTPGPSPGRAGPSRASPAAGPWAERDGALAGRCPGRGRSVPGCRTRRPGRCHNRRGRNRGPACRAPGSLICTSYTHR
jgi:hypothetical protein